MCIVPATAKVEPKKMGKLDLSSSFSKIDNDDAQCSRPSNSKKNTKGKIYVIHDYQDHFCDPYYDPIQAEEDRHGARAGPRGGVVEPFPGRLYSMLQKAESDGFASIVSWQPHGRCFLVHEPKMFVEDVMPRHFKQSKLTSFKRQVNLYGFQRLTRGADRGAYYHPLFLRGRPDLHKKIVRMRVKGTGCKPTSSPESEPNFYALPFCHEKSAMQCNSGISDSGLDAHSADDANPSQKGAGTEQASPSLFLSMNPPGTQKVAVIQQQVKEKIAEKEGITLPAVSHQVRANSGKDGQKFRQSSTASVDYRVSFREPIEEVCADPVLDSLFKARSTFSKGSAEALNNSCTVEGLLRPLPAPRGFQKFKNFRPISATSACDGSSHHDQKNTNDKQIGNVNAMDFGLPEEQACSSSMPLLGSPTQTHQPPPYLGAPSLSSLPQLAMSSHPTVTALSSLPEIAPLRSTDMECKQALPVEYHHDPFQDQIKDLLQAPMPLMGKDGAFGEDDLELVLGWIQHQPLCC